MPTGARAELAWIPPCVLRIVLVPCQDAGSLERAYTAGWHRDLSFPGSLRACSRNTSPGSCAHSELEQQTTLHAHRAAIAGLLAYSHPPAPAVRTSGLRRPDQGRLAGEVIEEWACASCAASRSPLAARHSDSRTNSNRDRWSSGNSSRCFEQTFIHQRKAIHPGWGCSARLARVRPLPPPFELPGRTVLCEGDAHSSRRGCCATSRRKGRSLCSPT